MISKRKQRLQKQLFGFVGKPKSVARRALNIAKSNKAVIKAHFEMKKQDLIETADTALNATPQITMINIAADTEGLRITAKSLQIRFVVKQNLASAIIDDYRVDVVLDRRPNKVEITPLLYLGDATPSIEAFKAFGEKSRYKILRTWSGYLSSSEGSNSFRKVNAFIKLNLVQEAVTQDSMAQSTIIKNAIYLVKWTTATANQPTFGGETRLVFQDSGGGG